MEHKMKFENKQKTGERGTAIIISLLVMALLMGFVVLALSRTTTETMATANDAAESRAFAAAQASLENMTRDFDKVFDYKLIPESGDLTNVQNAVVPGFSNYTFDQKVKKIGASKIVVVSGQQLQGLNALRQVWEMSTTATDLVSGVKVALKRQFFVDEVPIFQFGIFYDDNLEFHPGPRFDFGGRVHSNGSLFLAASTGLYFSSKVSANGQIVTDVARNGASYADWGDNVWVKNGSGIYKQVKYNMGSALKSPANGPNLFASNSDMPSVYKNSGWLTYKGTYSGNLLAEQPRLDLPLVIDSKQRGNQVDYVELVKRGKNVGDLYNDKSGTVMNPKVVAVPSTAIDSAVTSKERYANKSGIRISLSDTKDRLPGCAGVILACGKRLDEGSGYQPVKMFDDYKATPLNAARFQKSNYSNGVAREMWIKVETVQIGTNDLPLTKDITEDFLSLGVTEPAPIIKETGGRLNFQIKDTAFEVGGVLQTPGDAKYPDSRSIIKLQRFMIVGDTINSTSNFLTAGTNLGWGATTQFNSTSMTRGYNFVLANDGNDGSKNDIMPPDENGITRTDTSYLATVYDGALSRTTARVAPFPIMMFDLREGLYNEDLNTGTLYGAKVPMSGTMSIVDIDVANLRRFFNGDFNDVLPKDTPYALSKLGVSLKHTDVPNRNGWVLYVSDRRGDYDFDGEYDMEDVYVNNTTGNNDGITQNGEDVNNDGSLQADYNNGNEAPKYNVSVAGDAAAVLNTKYFRRGVRLINGTVLPGIYDATTAANTRGFTLASENGIYVQGNYNATGIRNVGTPTQSVDYLPQDTSTHIPASIVGDAVTILSNNWKDANSFYTPYSFDNRVASETTIRFAMLAGDTLSSKNATPNQGGGNPRMNGGVHNFKRFLEDWKNTTRLNYDGSLINLFNSHNNNGTFKCCTKIYAPPARNWVFDLTFLDPYRLPPGTPFFQSLSLTGFQRVNQ
jgi:hypothetical protein